jgi:hypothetical protein
MENLKYFPVLPGRLEFAVAIRHALLREQPEIVAVELPMSLEGAYDRAIRRLPEVSVILYEGESEDHMIYVPVEPADPFTEAVRTAREMGAEVVFIEPDLSPKPHLADFAPDPYSLKVVGYERFVEMYRATPLPRDARIEAHAKALAWRLQGADPTRRTAVVLSLNLYDAVLGAMTEPQEDPDLGRARRDVSLVNPHPECLAEILVEYPYLQSRYEEYRMLLDDPNIVDRPRVQLEVLRHAEETYKKNTGEEVKHWHRMQIAKFSRNLAMVEGRLVASVFDLSVAARGVVDDNYGWEVWESANRYPAQQTESDLETLNLSAEEVFFNTRRMRLRRRLPRFKQKLRPSALKKRKKERYPGEWAEQLDGSSICSYPPEDLVIENYGRFLKQKAKSILSDERERVEAFTTSLLDGIDIRETIRNWHERKIYVRHRERVSGDVGSVVVIFDDHDDDRYDYLTTWLGRAPERIGHGVLLDAPVRPYGRPGNRTGRVRRVSHDPAAPPHVRRLVGPGLRLRRDQGRTAIDGRARLLRRQNCRVRRAQAAAQRLPQHGGPDGTQDPVRSARAALAHEVEEAARRSRAGQPQPSLRSERLHLVTADLGHQPIH